MSIPDGIEQMIIVTSTFAQVIPGSGPEVNIIAVLVVWRFIVGVGVGASVGSDHPLSAVIASGFASTGSRGRLITTVFTTQSWGNFGALHRSCVEAYDAQLVLAVSLVALVTVHAYKDSINELEHIFFYWRILTGLGCIARAVALYFRLTVLETPRYTMDIDLNVQKAKADVENMLGLNGASAAVHWADPDAVVRRAGAPRRSE
jgi:PHS family inorganic phosphate transporter-like MFS transporter